MDTSVIISTWNNTVTTDGDVLPQLDIVLINKCANSSYDNMDDKLERGHKEFILTGMLSLFQPQ